VISSNLVQFPFDPNLFRRKAGAEDCDAIDIPADDLTEEFKQVIKGGRQKAALQTASGKKKPRDDRDIYGMHNCDPHKYYKSGFGGFVPFIDDLVGMNSAAESHVGANRYYLELRRLCQTPQWFGMCSFCAIS
jgi:hypothetical protein